LNKGHLHLEVPIPSFQQQVDRLVTLDHPRLAGTTEPDFRDRLEPLRASAEAIAGEDTPSRVPFVLVVTRDLVSPYDAVPLLHLPGSTKPGRVDRNHGEGDLDRYHPIEGSEPPGRRTCWSVSSAARSSATSAPRTRPPPSALADGRR